MLVLIFSLQSWTKADDIRDFEIEGMSIGDSLLDFFSEEKINSSYQIKYENDKYYKIEILSDDFKNYEIIGVYIKTNDKNYKILTIVGHIFFENNIEKCLNKKNNIEKEITKLFKEENSNSGKFSPEFDKKTTYYQKNYWLKSGNVISVTCYDWSSSIEKEKGWTDNLAVEIYKKEIADFIINVTKQKNF